jgi:SAM-dependent methyltransferase
VSDLYGDDLAAIHDLGFGDWARAAANVLLAHAPPGLVVDLGCGSGILAAEVAAHGRPVLGVDQSGAMLRLAGARVPAGEFRRMSLFDAELPPCAAVAVVGEGVNYDAGGDHVAKVKALLRRAYKALQPGGILLLDAAGPGRAKGGSRSWSEGKGWAAMAEASEKGDELTRRIVTFRQLSGEWRRAEETHTLRLLSLAALERDLDKVGFVVQRVSGYGPVELPKGHAAFIARKPSS